MALTQLALASGREVRLAEVHLYGTYAGMIDGTPNADMNDYEIARLVRRAERMFPTLPVHLISPPRRLYPRLGPGRAAGEYERLPSAGCFGRFTSDEVARPGTPVLDCELAVSELVVVWYQSDAATVIGPEVAPALSTLPWDELAVNVSVL